MSFFFSFFLFWIIQYQAAFVNCLYVARFTIVHSETQIMFPLLSLRGFKCGGWSPWGCRLLSNLNRFLPDAPICARSTVNRPITKMRTVFLTTMFLPVLKAKKRCDEINNVNPRISCQARKGKIANVKRQLHSHFLRTRGGVGMDSKVIWDVEIKNDWTLRDSLSKLVILEFIRTLNVAILLGKNIRQHFGWKAAIKYKTVLVDNQIDLIYNKQ